MSPLQDLLLAALSWRSMRAKKFLAAARSCLGGVGALLGCMVAFFGPSLITTDKQG